MDLFYSFFSGSVVLFRHCGSDRIYYEHCEKLYPERKAKFKNLYQETSPMKLLDYIRGLRKGKEAHRLERESMQDPFLADAMDGYSQVEGHHEQRMRYQQGFPVPEKEYDGRSVHCQRECFLQVG